MATTKKKPAVQTLTIPERVVTIKKKPQVVYTPWESNPNFAIRFNKRLNQFEETDGLTAYSPVWKDISWHALNGYTDNPTDYVTHFKNLIKLIQETK